MWIVTIRLYINLLKLSHVSATKVLNQPHMRDIPYSKKKLFISLILLTLHFLLCSTVFILIYKTAPTALLSDSFYSSLTDTVLLFASSAPLCVLPGLLVGWVYYRVKRWKYGAYDGRMRKRRRGYGIDPSDGEGTEEKEESDRRVSMLSTPYGWVDAKRSESSSLSLRNKQVS
jgi:hypothetical protein